MKKAQLSIEYVVLIAFGFMMLMFALIVVGDKMTQMGNEDHYERLQDVAYYIQSELYFASRASPGYQREFTIPLDLSGIEYDITNTNNELIVSTDKYEFGLYVPDLQGDLAKGTNIILNKDGLLCLEQDC